MQYIRVEWWRQISGCNTSGWKQRQPDVKWRQPDVSGGAAGWKVAAAGWKVAAAGWKVTAAGCKWRRSRVESFWQPPGGIPTRVECAGSHTPCILDFLKDSKELSSISDCFGDKKTIKTLKLNTI